MAAEESKAAALEQPLIEDRDREAEGGQRTEVLPPDGGFWVGPKYLIAMATISPFQAWLVMVACFLVNGIIFGIINTFGILFVRLKQVMEESGVEDASAKCSLVGSLTIGTTFFLSFIVGILSDKMGLRATALLGSCLATLGMGLSALVGYKQVSSNCCILSLLNSRSG